MRKGDRTQEAARIVVDSTGPSLTVTVEPWAPPGATSSTGAHWRPTALMERLSDALQVEDAPVSLRRLLELVTGKEAHIRIARDELVASGHVAIADGPNRATLHSLVTPYHQRNDPKSDVYRPGDTQMPPAVSECRPSLHRGPGDTHSASPGDTGATLGRHPSRENAVKADTCDVCSAPLLLARSGRTTCERCRLAAGVAS
jgi:hypothetical protein